MSVKFGITLENYDAIVRSGPPTETVDGIVQQFERDRYRSQSLLLAAVAGAAVRMK